MGHIHLGVLPQSRKWRDVVSLLSGGAADAEVLAATAIAAERDLEQASNDPVFVEAVRLLLLVPYAARSEKFAEALRKLGLDVGAEPDVLDITAAAGARLDDVARATNRGSDFGELAGRALIATLGTQIGDRLPGLFDMAPGDVRIAVRDLSSPKGIADLTRGYFGRLLSDCLASWLDRKLSTEIGPGKRFERTTDRSSFDLALAQYSSESTRIIREFAPGWYGKRLYEDGTITSERAAAFGAVCFKKISEELRRKRDADA